MVVILLRGCYVDWWGCLVGWLWFDVILFLDFCGCVYYMMFG